MITCDHPCSMAHSQRPQVLKHVKSRLQVQCAGDLFYGPNFPFELGVVWPAVLKRGLLLKSKLGTTSTKFGCLITFHHDRKNMVITRSKEWQQMFVDCFTALWPKRKSSDKSAKLVSNHKHIVATLSTCLWHDDKITSKALTEWRHFWQIPPGTKSVISSGLCTLLVHVASLADLTIWILWNVNSLVFYGSNLTI